MEPDLSTIKMLTMFNLLLVGLYGTLYIYSNSRMALLATCFFAFMSFSNITAIQRGMYVGGEFSQRKYIQTSQSVREPLPNSACCPPSERSKDKDESSLHAQKRKNTIHSEGSGPTLRSDPNPYQPIQRLDFSGECQPCPTD